MLVESGKVSNADPRELAGVIRTMFELAAPERWANIQFEVDEDHPAATPDSPLFSLLAARGPSSPLATVMAATTSGKHPQPAQIGLQHRAGQKAVSQLVEAGVVIPDDWQWVQDHPRRGLIVQLPEIDGTGAESMTDWLLSAMQLLNRSPTTGHVLYELHTGRDRTLRQ